MNHKAVLRTLALMLCLVQLLHARDVNPVLLSTYPAPPGGTTTDVAVSGNFVYACEGEKGLTILDVTNPSAPQFVGSVDTPGFASAVVVSNNLAFVADGTAGLTLVDISNRAAPAIVGSYDTLGNCTDVTVAGNLAYLADGDYGLQIIDCSNPSQPVRLGGYNTFGTALSVAISGNYAYLADDDNGLVVIDVSNPSAPRKIGGYDRLSVTHIAVSGTYAYVSSDGPLIIFDISVPTNPQPISAFDLPGFVTGSVVSGTRAYAVSGFGGFHVLDATDPFAPAILGTSSLITNAYRVARSDTLAFVAGLTNGVHVFAAENPAVMDVIARVPIPGNISDVAVRGNYAYLATGSSMLIVDVSKIDDMRLVATYPAFIGRGSVTAFRIAFVDAYIFLLDRRIPDPNYEILSSSDPVNPIKLSSSSFLGAFSDMKSDVSYLYLAGGAQNVGSGFIIGRIGPGPAIQPVGSFYNTGPNETFNANAIAIQGATAWAIGSKSLFSMPTFKSYIFRIDISNPSQPLPISSAEQSWASGQIAVSKTNGFVLSGNNLVAFDLESLAQIGSRTVPSAQTFAVETNNVYVTKSRGGIEVVSLQGQNLISLGGASLPDVTAIAIATNSVFIGAGTNGLYALTHAQAQVRLATEMTTNRTPVVKAFGPIGASGRLQRATDFTTNSFQDWQTIQLNSYPQTVTDTNSPRAFYRFVSP